MSPLVMDYIETENNVLYVTGLTAYPPLQDMLKPLIEQTRQIHQKRGTPVIRYHSLRYKAGSWSKYRRVVVKIDITEYRMNIRFIVTDMRQAKAKALFEQVYQPRGQAELYIKEHNLYLRSDKTSCNRFAANQFRLLLHSAAYVLLHSFRTNLLQHTQWAKASIQTIRLRIIKIGELVKELNTRINITFPSSCPENRQLVLPVIS